MQLILNGAPVTASLLKGLPRSVVISLFSWRRAEPGDRYDGPQKYGWWGDSFAEPGDRIGSRLWQLLRRSITAELLTEIEEAAQESLQWLIDDGVCASVDLKAERDEVNRINLTVTLHLNDEQLQLVFKDVNNGND